MVKVRLIREEVVDMDILDIVTHYSKDEVAKPLEYHGKSYVLKGYSRLENGFNSYPEWTVKLVEITEL